MQWGQEEMDQCWKWQDKHRKRFWTSMKSRTAKERLTEVGAPFWNGGVHEEAGSTGYGSGEKTVGQESSPCSVSTTCSVGKACIKIPRKKAAKNEDYERYSEEHQIKRKNGC